MHCVSDQHGLGSKTTYTILLFPWERNSTALFPARWSWQAVLNSCHNCKQKNQNIKFQVESNILVFHQAGWVNCLPYVLVTLSLSCESTE